VGVISHEVTQTWALPFIACSAYVTGFFLSAKFSQMEIFLVFKLT